MSSFDTFTVAAVRCSQNYGEALRTHDCIDQILKDSLIGLISGFTECQCKNLSLLVMQNSSIQNQSESLDDSPEEEQLAKIMASTAIGSGAGALVECAKCFINEDTVLQNQSKYECLTKKGLEGVVGVSCAVVGEAVVTAFGVQNVGGVVGGMLCRGLLSKVLNDSSNQDPFSKLNLKYPKF
eukprot:TRINITY_DN16938_c0_g3_i1.p3 TRINITY_DN16938_c0_g3~~TRINITY_DN16938_c0_g3_i1.p3  ORF type:complete len:182 (-),score=27.33 TRINITY_DN16938_c0_g3_i1:776-1321(-)